MTQNISTKQQFGLCMFNDYGLFGQGRALGLIGMTYHATTDMAYYKFSDGYHSKLGYRCGLPIWPQVVLRAWAQFLRPLGKVFVKVEVTRVWSAVTETNFLFRRGKLRSASSN